MSEPGMASRDRTGRHWLVGLIVERHRCFARQVVRHATYENVVAMIVVPVDGDVIVSREQRQGMRILSRRLERPHNPVERYEGPGAVDYVSWRGDRVQAGFTFFVTLCVFSGCSEPRIEGADMSSPPIACERLANSSDLSGAAV